MFKHNSDITGTRTKPDDTVDKQSSKTPLLFCINFRGDKTQAGTYSKIQIVNNKVLI